MHFVAEAKLINNDENSTFIMIPYDNSVINLLSTPFDITLQGQNCQTGFMPCDTAHCTFSRPFVLQLELRNTYTHQPPMGGHCPWGGYTSLGDHSTKCHDGHSKFVIFNIRRPLAQWFCLFKCVNDGWTVSQEIYMDFNTGTSLRIHLQFGRK